MVGDINMESKNEIKWFTCQVKQINHKTDYCSFYHPEYGVKCQTYSYCVSVVGHDFEAGEEIELQQYFLEESDSFDYGKQFLEVDHIEKFDETLALAIAELLKEPTWFSEADIQSSVYSKLLEIPELKKMYETSVSIGMNTKGEMSKKYYKTNRLHREYGINGLDNTRCDLVVFPEDEIKNITDLLNLRTGKDKNSYLNPEIMIEFGTEKSASSSIDFKKHIKNDIKKTAKSSNTGYIIHIQRTATKNNEIKKYETEFCDVLKELTIPSNVKVLFFLVSIGCNVRIFKVGKVKLFKNGKLKGINQDEYKAEILELLK